MNITTYYPDIDSINKIPDNSSVSAIMVHHSVSGENTKIEDLHKWHVKDRGFNAIGYHLVIFRDGKVIQTRPFDKCGAHCEIPSGIGKVGSNGLTKSWNHHSLGVCFIGDFRTDEVTQAQWQSFSDVCYLLFRSFNLSTADITWHRKATKGRTECPGPNLISKLENIQLNSETIVTTHEPVPVEKTLTQFSTLDLIEELSKRIHAQYDKN